MIRGSPLLQRLRGGRDLDVSDGLLFRRFFSNVSKQTFGVSTRFVHEIVARFRAEAVSSELDSYAPYGGARASEGSRPSRGGGGSSRKGGGKQRRRGGSKKQAESDVSELTWNRQEEAQSSDASCVSGPGRKWSLINPVLHADHNQARSGARCPWLSPYSLTHHTQQPPYTALLYCSRIRTRHLSVCLTF